jgi:hypothetical protein
MDDGRGHRRSICREIAAMNGVSQRGWHAPSGQFFDCPTELHKNVAHALIERFYPKITGTEHPIDELLARGWVRACCDGHYEVSRFEGCPKKTIVDLAALLSPNSKIIIDIIEFGRLAPSKIIEGLTAGELVDKYQ